MRSTAMKYALRVISGMAIVLLLGTCGALQKGAKKLVYIEYDQLMNFDTYDFGTQFNMPGSGTVQTVTLVYNQADAVHLWLYYKVCLVANEGSDAKAFTFDVSKFYVEHGGDRFYARKLQAGQYAVGVGLNAYTPNSAEHPTVADHFNDETGNVDHTHTVPPGDTDNEDYGFVIQMRFPVAPLDANWQATRLKLEYNATGVLLGDRGWSPLGGRSLND